MSTPAGALAPWAARQLMGRHTTRDWVDGAACAQTDPELFFPSVGQPGLQAKVVCLGCPVKQQCLEYAINSPVLLEGIWGGTNLRQRQELRRQRGIRTNNTPDRCGTEAGARRHYRAGEKLCQACIRAAQVADHNRRSS